MIQKISSLRPNRMKEKKEKKCCCNKAWQIICLFVGIGLIIASYKLKSEPNNILLGLGTGLLTSTLVAWASDRRMKKKIKINKAFMFSDAYSSCKNLIGHFLWMSIKYNDDLCFKKELDCLQIDQLIEFRVNHTGANIPDEISGKEALEKFLALSNEQICINRKTFRNTLLVLQQQLNDLLDKIDDINNNKLFFVQEDFITVDEIKELERDVYNIKILLMFENLDGKILIEKIVAIYTILNKMGSFDDSVKIDFTAMMTNDEFKQYIDNAIAEEY